MSVFSTTLKCNARLLNTPLSLLKHSNPYFKSQASCKSKILRKSYSDLVSTKWHDIHAERPFFQRSVIFVGFSTVGLGLWLVSRPIVQCEPSRPSTPSAIQPPPEASNAYPPPPKSSVNLYELSFGTVCGICAGVFIKKGAKALAFVLGGAFVMLQYLGSVSVVRVDWSRLATRFENLFYTTDVYGTRRPPSIVSLWNWLIDFLTADFQPRASFIAGLALGLRIG